MQTALSNLRTTPAPCSTHRAAFRAPSQGHRLRACNSGFRTFGPYGQGKHLLSVCLTSLRIGLQSRTFADCVPHAGSPLMGMFGLNTNDRRVQGVSKACLPLGLLLHCLLTH